MKYIRTKDGRIIDCVKLMNEAKKYILKNEDDYKLAHVLASGTYDTDLGWQRRVIKQADTIKELCDVFVTWVENESQTPVCVNLCEDTKRAYELTREGILLYMADGVKCWLKLGIWVEDGMKYVAKMNEKGDFELV